MIADFELGLKTAVVDNYSRRLVEFCSHQALQIITSHDLGGKISDGSFSQFTFNMMLAWETPTPSDQQITMVGDSACVTQVNASDSDAINIITGEHSKRKGG